MICFLRTGGRLASGCRSPRGLERDDIGVFQLILVLKRDTVELIRQKNMQLKNTVFIIVTSTYTFS